MTLRRTTDAVTEPVLLAEAKAHLRVTVTDDDDYISALLVAARQMAETELRRALMTQTWTKTLDQFPDAIRLDYPPIQSVTSVKYFDTAGVQQTMDPADYEVDIQSEPGYIVPAYGTCWPETLCTINAVEVVYVAGWTSEDDVPQSIKNWMLLHIGHFYENREATMPGITITPLPFISGLIDQYRVFVF